MKTTTQPFDLGLVERYLQPLQDEKLLSKVAGMVEYTTVKDLTSFVLPSAYVIMGPETAAPSPVPKAQVVDCLFGVVVVVRNLRVGSSGTAALRDELYPILGAIRERLIGWKPPELFKAVQWVRGEPLENDKGVLVWLDQYRAQHVVRGRKCAQ